MDSDEYVRGVHFDDSEEERMKGFNEGLDEVFDDGAKVEQKYGASINEEGIAHVDKKMFITEEMGKEHVIEDAYMIDELDNCGDDDSCDE
ncbi:unnamed protein product [Lathyrus sativus]|nr:unnamed protein product [Lathyrus sativus]